MTELSPAAQAVLAAICYDMPNRVLAAAAIRAAADQIVPADTGFQSLTFANRKFYALAAELEAQ
jgi:hypothetical protein